MRYFHRWKLAVALMACAALLRAADAPVTVAEDYKYYILYNVMVTAGAIMSLRISEGHRDGMGGAWQEKDLTFDASLMKQGANNLQLMLPDGSVTNGLIYDHLRLELNEQMTVDGKPL
jgi:hypothetical protein